MLNKKMFRDILSNKGSYIACLVIVLIGLVIFTSFSIVSDNLVLSKDIFYTEQNFADGFIELHSMPVSSLERLSDIEGIEDISGRVVEEVRVYDPDRREAVYLKLVFQNTSEVGMVNSVKLMEGGQMVEDLDFWLDNQFFSANNFSLGEEIKIIAGGRIRELTIAGVGMSPEFTYPLRTEAELYPNPELFGIGFISIDGISSFFPEMAGRVNDIVFTLEPGANFDRVKESLEPSLEQYGLKAIYPRDDQISHFILNEEIEQLNRMSTALPVLFLAIAGIILYIMLKRLVEQQRVQIGILKAFGYSNLEISLHYMSYALIVGGFGGFLGGILGILAAYPLTQLMLEFFAIPMTYTGFSLYHFLTGMMLSLTIFLISGYQGCKPALKLKPAEAMRPPAPPSGKKVILEKLSFFWNMLTIQGMMAVRNLSRNRGRSAFMFLGLMLSFSIVAITWALNDMVDKLMFYQYQEVEVYDAKLSLKAPGLINPINRELSRMSLVSYAEPLAEVPVSLHHRWLEENILLMGIFEGSNLYNIIDLDGNRILPPKEGLILSERLAEKLQAEKGTILELKSPMMRGDDPVEVSVVDIIPQYIGMNAYMELSSLEQLLGRGSFSTALLINLEKTGNKNEAVFELRNHYLESDMVAGLDGREEMIGKTKELMDTFGSMVYIYVFLGVIICFSIIYSSSFITLSERERELASMRVLGMTPNEVFSVITFEQWFLSIFSMILGVPLAMIMQRSLAAELSTDIYSLPGDLSNESFLAAFLITSFSIWIAQRFALKKVHKLSLVEVLKSRD